MTSKVVAVIGGGQLARMSVAPAIGLGLDLRVLCEAADGSAGQVVANQLVGAANDVDAVLDLVRGAEVLTFEHEHVPAQVLAAVAEAGVPIYPSPEALQYAQDKILMRQRLSGSRLPVPAWQELAGPGDLAEFIAQWGPQVIVKTSRGGYDGKGVRVVSDPQQVADWFAAAADGGPQLLAEQKVPFTRELSALVARRPSGDVRTWPVVASQQLDGVCFQVTAPADELHPDTAAQAQRVAVQIAEQLDVVGVLAVELFEVPGAEPGQAPQVLVNELAMRPHNSGHWTIDGSVTSQFEQHLRAVLDLPLGDTAPTAPWTVMTNVLGSTLDRLTDALPQILSDGGVKAQLYGKEIRPGRKLGHVNVSGTDLEQVRAASLRAATALMAPQDGE